MTVFVDVERNSALQTRLFWRWSNLKNRQRNAQHHKNSHRSLNIQNISSLNFCLHRFAVSRFKSRLMTDPEYLGPGTWISNSVCNGDLQIGTFRWSKTFALARFWYWSDNIWSWSLWPANTILMHWWWYCDSELASNEWLCSLRPARFNSNHILATPSWDQWLNNFTTEFLNHSVHYALESQGQEGGIMEVRFAVAQMLWYIRLAGSRFVECDHKV